MKKLYASYILAGLVALAPSAALCMQERPLTQAILQDLLSLIES